MVLGQRWLPIKKYYTKESVVCSCINTTQNSNILHHLSNNLSVVALQTCPTRGSNHVFRLFYGTGETTADPILQIVDEVLCKLGSNGSLNNIGIMDSNDKYLNKDVPISGNTSNMPTWTSPIWISSRPRWTCKATFHFRGPYSYPEETALSTQHLVASPLSTQFLSHNHTWHGNDLTIWLKSLSCHFGNAMLVLFI